MKTNRFEEILRRKLESLKPDFQAQDWDKFQAFQQHAAPSFWQTYGHWLGYAVAMLTTATVAVLYVNQSRQNDALLQEMKELRQQIARGTDGPARGFQPVLTDSSVTTAYQSPTFEKTGKPASADRLVPYADTVYIIEPRVIYRDRPLYEGEATRAELAESSNNPLLKRLENSVGRQEFEKSEKVAESNRLQEKTTENLSLLPTESQSQTEKSETGRTRETDVPAFDAPKSKSGQASADEASPTATPASTGNLPQDRVVINDIKSLPTPSLPEAGKTAYRRLMNRMPRVTQKQAAPVAAKSEKIAESRTAPSKPAPAESVEKVTKEESLLPKFGLNLPFRVGAGQQWEGRTKAFSLWNEVMLGEHWSIQTGLSWQKLEDQKFFDERVFYQKMHKDFRKNHAEKLPPSFDIFNIIACTNVLRIPLNLTYRNEISNGFSYFIGAGTAVNLRARQTLSFDFERPSRDYGQESKERTIPFPMINNVNALVGVEKRWSPIVLQVSSFLNTRFQTFPFLEDRTDAGLQVKLLYEFKTGRKQ